MAAGAGAACDFARDYEIAQSPLMREIEFRVRGSRYGATSWTTRQQADATVARMGLSPGLRLLDVGSGSGWPALHLSAVSGCEAVLVDLPLSGLRIARQRAEADGLDGRCSVLAADGSALPFSDASFDRLHHADVLCCMTAKREMLAECRRVARPGALMEFSVIRLARTPGDDAERRLIERSGPSHPDVGEDYETLLQSTGWRVLVRDDVTGEFIRCMEVLLHESRRREKALVELLGAQDHAERLDRRHSTRQAVSVGLLVREIFLCERAGAKVDGP
jgi:SAM-dependent methyltransferase